MLPIRGITSTCMHLLLVHGERENTGYDSTGLGHVLVPTGYPGAQELRTCSRDGIYYLLHMHAYALHALSSYDTQYHRMPCKDVIQC